MLMVQTQRYDRQWRRGVPSVNNYHHMTYIELRRLYWVVRLVQQARWLLSRCRAGYGQHTPYEWVWWWGYL